MKRPRLLLPLALLAFLYGASGITSGWMMIIGLSSSHDRYLSAIRNETSIPDAQRPIVERSAETLWSRRGALIPLAAGGILAATLVLFGAARTLRRGPRSAWGRSAWQLGALLGVPTAALEGVTSWLHARDLTRSIADLSDPVSQQVRQLAPMSDRLLLAQAALTALYLGGVALYLNGEAVKRWAGTTVED